MRNGPNWGLIAAVSLLGMTVIAVALLLIGNDLAWVAAMVFAIGLVDAWFLWRVVPRMTGATSRDRIDALNAEAEAESRERAGDWDEPVPPADQA